MYAWISTKHWCGPYEPTLVLESDGMNKVVNFVEDYGIAMCYYPICPTDSQTVVDAPDGYIALCISLFSIGNLRLLFNHSCLVVFKFFNCHFPLLNPFGFACVTSFAVSYKAYGGELTLPLFRSLCSVGPTKSIFLKETLFSKAYPDLITSFRHGIGTFNFSYPNEPFDEILCERLICHLFEAKTFPEAILYIVGLVGSWEEASSILSIFVGDKGTIFEITRLLFLFIVLPYLIFYSLFFLFRDVIQELLKLPGSRAATKDEHGYKKRVRYWYRFSLSGTVPVP
uniref:Uncharacterized protein n=1 Tax=Tanacetum cinerariifolium TaxID=118510 RepID=A0A699H7J9_TANCI|nr:hypothetical protein [Tanacetum cinerariifolium]